MNFSISIENKHEKLCYHCNSMTHLHKINNVVQNVLKVSVSKFQDGLLENG